MNCNQCGTQNSGDERYCSNCHAELWTVDPVADEEQQVSAADQSEDREIGYRVVIGDKNTGYYLERFLDFDSGGIRPTWNWPAFFVSFFWLLYRKMWLFAALYLLVPFCVQHAADFLAGPIAETTTYLSINWVVIVGVFFIAFPMYANAIYYSHAKRKIGNSEESGEDRDSQLRALSASGGTNRGVLWLGWIFGAIAVFGLVAAVAIPAYQDFSVREDVAAGDAIVEMHKVKVEEFAMTHQRWPQHIDEIGGFAPVTDAPIENLSIYQNGILVLTFRSSFQMINGKSLIYLPAVREGMEFQWHCGSEEIADHYLPAVCQSTAQEVPTQ